METLRRNANRARIGMCLAGVLVMVACTGNPTQPPLTDLHLPGVRRIANLDALQRSGQIIYAAAAYSPAGSSDTRVIFDVAGQLYSIGLNGSDLRSISGGNPCFEFTPTPDGRSVACSDDAGIEVVSLAADASFRTAQLLRAKLMDRMTSPTWSPDGSDLALINRGPNAGCKVAFYHVPGHRSATDLLATLTLPMFTGLSGEECELNAISWSRDGAWLALVANDAARNPELSVYVYSMTHLSLLAGSTADAPIDVIVAQNDLVRIGEAHHSTSISWSNQGAHQLLTMVDQDLLSIVQIEPPAGTRGLLLKIPGTVGGDARNYGFVCSITWTPDGAQLDFVDCAPGNIEVPAVPSKLYVYAPPQPSA